MNHWKSHRTTIFLSVLFLVLSLTPVAFGQTPSILGGAKERQPSYGELENFTILSYSDLDGWDQAAEFRVSKDGKHAYISNYQGFSILDVSDPARPKVVSKIKNDPSVQSQYIDVLGNLLVVNQEGVRDEKIKSWTSGIRLFDISDPAKPKEVGFYKTDGAPNRGVHGFWLHEDPKQGKFAFIATTLQGYFGAILLIIDINNPGRSEGSFALVVPRTTYRRRGKGRRKLDRRRRAARWAAENLGFTARPDHVQRPRLSCVPRSRRHHPGYQRSQETYQDQPDQVVPARGRQYPQYRRRYTGARR